METDWAENRSKIPQDFIRRTLGKVLDSLYDTGERDKYKTRLEVLRPGETEVYITQRGALEKCLSDSANTCNSTVWTPRPNDPQLEAVFLTRLMERLGVSQESARAQLAAAAAAPAKTPKAKFVQEGANTGRIDMSSSFDRAWRDAGLALDRSNFTVEDRDRSKGIYFVRYVNPKEVGESKGFFSKLFSSRDDSSLKAKRYRVVLKSSSDNLTQIYVQDDAGNPENTPAGYRLLTLLDEQLIK
jgi:outer membrane protein assembly factor BamC